MQVEEEASPQDLIQLNIGGETVVMTQRLTLMQAEGSTLEAMFRGTWRNLTRDSEGNAFIDQSPSLFLPLLNYLRARRDENPNGLRAQPPKDLGPAFDVMVEFYNMTMFVYRLELRIISMPPPEDAVITQLSQSSWSISSPDHWMTVDLHRLGHSRKITKYTVVMGIFSHARIGWRDVDMEYPSYDASPQNRQEQARVNPAKGVGDFPGTIAYDCVEPMGLSVYVNGDISLADGENQYDCPYPLEGKDIFDIDRVEEGTRIECMLPQPKERVDIYQDEVRPCWIVNGNLTDSFAAFSWAPNHAAPCISIRGSLQITEVEYDNVR